MQSIRINPLDNVAVMLDDSSAEVPRGHKFALRDIAAGENIIKYGMPIGRATCAVRKGEHVHTNNMKTNLDGILEYAYSPVEITLRPEPCTETFKGFRRKNGAVGIRNHIFIIPTVGCVNKLAHTLAERLNRTLPAGSVDRAVALEHPFGCSQLGGDHEMTRAILCGLVKHPNAAASSSSGSDAKTTPSIRSAKNSESSTRSALNSLLLRKNRMRLRLEWKS